MKCSSASLIVQGVSIYLYLKPIGIFQKSPAFSCWTSIFYEIIGVNRYIVPFYYVVPENLVTVDEVPTYAGLVYIKPCYDREGKIWYDANVVKVAPKLHKEKIDEAHLKLIDKFYYNYRSWKHKYEDDLTYYKKRLDEVRTVEGEKFKYTLPEAMQQIEVLTEEKKKNKEDIENIEKERLYGTYLNRKLMKLLRDNNIEYEDMVRKYDEEFWGEKSKF